jgi:hypothetical protein
MPFSRLGGDSFDSISDSLFTLPYVPSVSAGVLTVNNFKICLRSIDL